MLKAANVEMIGWDKAGSGMVTAFVKGDVAAVKAAVDAGAEAAGRVGSVIAVHVIARPHDDLGGMMPKAKKAAPVRRPPGRTRGRRGEEVATDVTVTSLSLAAGSGRTARQVHDQ